MNKRVARLNADREKVNQKTATDTSGTVRMDLAIRDGKVVVTAIPEGSSTSKCGIEVGDVLLAIDDRSIAGLEIAQINARLAGSPESNIQLRFDRNGSNVLIAMPRETARKLSK